MKKIVNVPFTVDWCDAFSLLCEVLDMKDLVTSEEDLYIYKGSVCRKNKETGNYEPVDDRADLFAALRNVANALVPNLDFRSDPYITNWGSEDDLNWSDDDDL